MTHPTTIRLRQSDVLKMYYAVALDKKKLPFRVLLGGSAPIHSTTFMGKGWTLRFGVMQNLGITRDLSLVEDMQFYGNREQFEEDFILAKCMIG